MIDLLSALGLLLVLEGLAYAAFPNAMRSALVALLSMPQAHVRTVGLTTAIIGLVIVWLVRG